MFCLFSKAGMIRNYLVENPLLMKEMGLVRVKLEESFDRIFWRYIECRVSQNQSWKSTLLQLVNFEKFLVLDAQIEIMGWSFIRFDTRVNNHSIVYQVNPQK